MVRLLRRNLQSSRQIGERVSIPQWCDCCLFSAFAFFTFAPLFQSHNGAIAAAATATASASVDEFQSHNGAIAAKFPLFRCNESRTFQSHNGAIAASNANSAAISSASVSIPQWCDCCSSSSDGVFAKAARFNPTMVRLLRNHFRPDSHACCCFNPTMVRLLLGCQTFPLPPPIVSIPQWCDCCLGRRMRFLSNAKVSIPQWCDCCYKVPLKASFMH